MNSKFTEKMINRLTLYHCILIDYVEKNIEYITSPQIASLLKIDDSQVRKDLKILNNTGKCKVGYNVLLMKEAIEKALRFEKQKNAFIIGAGNLGLALAKYDNFTNYGLNILALFDNNTLKVDMKINNKEVHHISELEKLTKELDVEIAILTVPREAAQVATDILINAGIKYIWNFTPSILRVPNDVQVWNENLMGNFLQFTAGHRKEEL